MKTTTTRVVAATCATVLAWAATTALAQSSVSIKSAFAQRLTVEFVEQPLDQVMDWVGTTSGLNVVTRWERLEEMGVDRDTPISLRLQNIRMSQIMHLIMNQAGGADVKLAYRASGNLLVLSTADDLGEEMITRVYDVSDLIQRIQDFEGPDVEISQAAQGGGGQGGGGQSIFGQGGGNDEEDQNDDENNEEIQELMDIIRSTIEPDSWRESASGEGSIHAFRNLLIVRNSIRVHQELGGPVYDPD